MIVTVGLGLHSELDTCGVLVTALLESWPGQEENEP